MVIKCSICLLLLIAAIIGTFYPLASAKCPAVQTKKKNLYGLENEYAVIYKAAVRNVCKGNLFNILLAIRKAENGPAGFEFGVVAAKGTNLDTQAGWAAATVVKNYRRFAKLHGIDINDCKDWWVDDFIKYLGNIYCPPSADLAGNKHWINNVKHWYLKFED